MDFFVLDCRNMRGVMFSISLPLLQNVFRLRFERKCGMCVMLWYFSCAVEDLNEIEWMGGGEDGVRWQNADVFSHRMGLGECSFWRETHTRLKKRSEKNKVLRDGRVCDCDVCCPQMHHAKKKKGLCGGELKKSAHLATACSFELHSNFRFERASSVRTTRVLYSTAEHNSSQRLMQISSL